MIVAAVNLSMWVRIFNGGPQFSSKYPRPQIEGDGALGLSLEGGGAQEAGLEEGAVQALISGRVVCRITLYSFSHTKIMKFGKKKDFTAWHHN